MQTRPWLNILIAGVVGLVVGLVANLFIHVILIILTANDEPSDITFIIVAIVASFLAGSVGHYAVSRWNKEVKVKQSLVQSLYSQNTNKE